LLEEGLTKGVAYYRFPCQVLGHGSSVVDISDVTQPQLAVVPQP
jgi:hypothetical protein